MLVLVISQVAQAGLHGFTMHSRANCANNESISWWAGHSFTGWQTTWRSAAVHWGEGTGGWYVLGHHWGIDSHRDKVLLSKTDAIDCRWYDGWWG